MSRTAYINARLLDPKSELDAIGALLTEGTRIADVGPDLFAEGVPEASRRWIALAVASRPG